MAKGPDITYELDETKIEEEKKYDGFYTVATNLKEDRVRDILAITHKRYQIEDCFRIMKTQFLTQGLYFIVKKTESGLTC